MGAAGQQAASNRSQGPFLRWLGSAARGAPSVVALGRLVTLIGARSKCQVCVKAEDVSRRHALLLNAGGRLFVRDLNSRTGTYCNGERVREAYLKDGDVLRVGPAEWEVGGAGDGAASGIGGRRPFPAGVRVEGADLPLPQLSGPVFLIGRRHGSDLCVRDARVSAAHAAIVDDGEGGWTLVDLFSHDGTALGELAVDSVRLNPGDTVRVADTRFQFQLAVQQTRPTAPPPPLPAPAPVPEPTAAETSDDRDLLTISDVPDEPPSFSDLPSEDYGLNGVAAGSGAALRELAAAAAEAQASHEQADPAPAAPPPVESPFATEEFDLDALASSDAEEELVLERAQAELFEAEPEPPPPPPPVEKSRARPKVTFAPLVTAGRAAEGPPPGVTIAVMNPFTLEVVPPTPPTRSKSKAAKAADDTALDPVES